MSKFSSWLAPQSVIEINGVSVTLTDPGVEVLEILPQLEKEMGSQELTKESVIALVKGNTQFRELTNRLVYLCAPELAKEKLDLTKLKTSVLFVLLNGVFQFLSELYPQK